MAAHRFEVRIRRSADDVWAYLADPSHEVEWQQGVASSVHDPPGRIRTGTRKTKVRRTPMGSQEFVVEYTRVDHGAREWEDLVVSGSVAGSTGHYQVLADGTSSRVVLDVVMRARGLARLFMPMIDRLTRNDLQGGFDRLKPILERG